jgi:tetratricopeptide (TPR) repeat protein
MRSITALLVLAAGLEAGSWMPLLEEANRLRDSGQSAAAEQIYQQILAGADNLAPLDLNALGTAFCNQARYRDAELLLRKALTDWDRRGNGNPLDRVLIKENLGVVLRTENRLAEAETLLLDSLRQIESLTGRDSTETGHAASGLASLYLVWGDLPKAESYALRADVIFAKLPQAHARERRNNQRLLGTVYVQQRRFDEARVPLEELVSGEEDHLAPGAYNDLAVAALDQHRPAEAESWARHGLEIAGRTLPTSHPDRATVLNSLAQACRFQGKYVEAEKYYREAIAVWTASLGAGHPTTAKGYFNLAGFYHERGREAGAEELYRRAAEVFESAYGQNHAMTLVSRNELAEVLRAEGRYTESEKLSRSTLAALEQTLGSDDERVVRALANRVRLLESTGRAKEAALLRNRIPPRHQA